MLHHRVGRTRAACAALAVTALTVVCSATPASAAGRNRIVVQPGQSIQAAIDALPPGGGTVEVLGGVYHENLAIEKNNVRIVGTGAQLLPPDGPVMTPCDDILGGHGGGSAAVKSSDETMPAMIGICVGGNPDQPVRGATIVGMDIENFAEMGVFVFNGRDTQLIGNTSNHNGGYGLAAFSSSRTRVDSNHVEGNGEAGIYIGDSPDADATVTNNESEHNGFGIFLRDSQHGGIRHNNVHDNCLGILALADAPGPAGDYTVAQNTITHNNQLCPGSEDSPGDISGVGVGIVGAHGMTIRENDITQNIPATNTVPIAAGVSVVQGDGGTPPNDNKVKSNNFVGNQTDIFWDATGMGNVFTPNSCSISSPAALCA